MEKNSGVEYTIKLHKFKVTESFVRGMSKFGGIRDVLDDS